MGVPVLQRGQVAIAVFTRDVRLLRQMYHERKIPRQVSADTRLVVSDPIGDLPGAWNEVPEASYGVVGGDTTSCCPSPPARPKAR